MPKQEHFARLPEVVDGHLARPFVHPTNMLAGLGAPPPSDQIEGNACERLVGAHAIVRPATLLRCTAAQIWLTNRKAAARCWVCAAPRRRTRRSASRVGHVHDLLNEPERGKSARRHIVALDMRWAREDEGGEEAAEGEADGALG